MNALEYVVIGENLGAPVSDKEMMRERARLATITATA